MKASTIIVKIKNRLNKLDSQDYNNLASWVILEAFNKAQIEWCRRNAHGNNLLREGDEQSVSRIDDLEKLLKNTPDLNFIDRGIYYESTSWPSDYLRYKRVDLAVKNDCCDVVKRMTVYLGEEANVDIYLNDDHTKPDYNWAETFAVIKGGKLNVYHNKEFTIDACQMVYYRKPTRVTLAGVIDDYTGVAATANVDCEFDDDLAEIMVMSAADILAGDIQNSYQQNRLDKDLEKNN